MPRFLFLTWNGAGNQPPAVAIAQALRERGHAVTFAGYENQRAYFAARDFEFHLLERASTAWRDDTPEKMFDVKLQCAWAAAHHLEDVPSLIARERCDALLVDCLLFGALAAVERLQVPAAALVHSAPGALMPPGGRFESLVLEPVNALRTRAGLPAVGSLWEAWARFPALSNSIRRLDPLESQAPGSFFYCGPVAERLPTSAWTPPWGRADRRPLVLVSFSTGPYWDQSSRILRTLEALSGYDCRVLVTAAAADVPADLVPDNAAVVARIPHDQVLPDVAVTITHAGHGTVMASLKHGVPLLCLPNSAADQPILAAQAAALGVGLALDGELASPADIRAATDRLLTDPSYARNARRLAREIAAAPGVAAMVSRLEQLPRAEDARADSAAKA